MSRPDLTLAGDCSLVSLWWNRRLAAPCELCTTLIDARLQGHLTRSHCRHLLPWRPPRWQDRPISLITKTHAHDDLLWTSPKQPIPDSFQPQFAGHWWDWCDQTRSLNQRLLTCVWNIGTFLTVSSLNSVFLEIYEPRGSPLDARMLLYPLWCPLPDTGGAQVNDSVITAALRQIRYCAL